MRHLSPIWLEDAWQAKDTCWFDYRRLHPVKALLYFRHVFSEANGHYLESGIDVEMRFNKGLKGDPLVHREIRQLWYLMLEADRRCIPYKFWLYGMFDWFARSGWTRPPRPAHLLSNKDAQEHAQLRWAAAIEEVTHASEDPWFRSGNFEGHQYQLDHEQWIVDSIRKRNNRDIAISSAIYDLQALRIERAAIEFPEHTLPALRWAEQLQDK